MTDKRFKLHLSEDKETFWISDVETHKEHHIQIFHQANVITHLLNEQHETNEQLRHDATILIQSNHDYRKENEELKTQLQNTSDQRDEFYRGARENANRIGKLKKENEQLKKELAEVETKLYKANDELFRQDDYLVIKEENEQLKIELEAIREERRNEFEIGNGW